MFENLLNFFKKKNKIEDAKSNKDTAKERLHLVLMQDRANVSADFLEMMKQEIIEVIKKYVNVDEDEINVTLTNQVNSDGTTGAPALYANIPIKEIKNEARTVKIKKDEITNNNTENSKENQAINKDNQAKSKEKQEANKENQETNKKNQTKNKENQVTDKYNQKTNKENREINEDNQEKSKENKVTSKDNQTTNKENQETNKDNQAKSKENQNDEIKRTNVIEQDGAENKETKK